MKGATRRTIKVISHGPSCLDGVMAAAAIERFYRDQRVTPSLVANGEADRALGELKSRGEGGADEIWITDLSWNSLETARHLTGLANTGTPIYWIDHHRS